MSHFLSMKLLVRTRNNNSRRSILICFKYAPIGIIRMTAAEDLLVNFDSIEKSYTNCNINETNLVIHMYYNFV